MCLRCAKTAERIEVLFGVKTIGTVEHEGHIVLHRVPIPTERRCVGTGIRWGFHQITLAICLHACLCVSACMRMLSRNYYGQLENSMDAVQHFNLAAKQNF